MAKPRPSILSFYPYPEFRLGHRETLLEIEKRWDTTDVILVVAPTGSGKTSIRRTVAAWAKSEGVVMLVPTNQLITQELQTYPRGAVVLQSKDVVGDGPAYKESFKRAAMWRSTPTLMVPHMLISVKHMLRGRSVLVMDEGHRLVEINKELQTIHIWRDELEIPFSVRTRDDLIAFLEPQKTSRKIAKIIEKLSSNNYFVEREKALRHGKFVERVRVIPITPEIHPSLNFPKTILMSGTLNVLDLQDVGIGTGRRVLTLELPSPIPPENRPVELVRGCGKINFANAKVKAGVLAGTIKDIASFHGDVRGLVHTTYSLAAELRRYLGADPRFLFHDKDTSKSVLSRWQKDGGIFVACGYDEGLDLIGEDYTYQIVTKVPYPSLADSTIKKHADLHQAWYVWQTLRKLLQTLGRISRGPDDFGVTYILDESSRELFRSAAQLGLLPGYAREVLKI